MSVVYNLFYWVRCIVVRKTKLIGHFKMILFSTVLRTHQVVKKMLIVRHTRVFESYMHWCFRAKYKLWLLVLGGWRTEIVNMWPLKPKVIAKPTLTIMIFILLFVERALFVSRPKLNGNLISWLDSWLVRSGCSIKCSQRSDYI